MCHLESLRGSVSVRHHCYSIQYYKYKHCNERSTLDILYTFSLKKKERKKKIQFLRLRQYSQHLVTASLRFIVEPNSLVRGNSNFLLNESTVTNRNFSFSFFFARASEISFAGGWSISESRFQRSTSS